MRHKTKDKGDLGLTKTISDLLQYSIRCCVPLSEHLPFDLIAVMPDFTTLRRVQVKYRKIARRGCIELNFRSNYYDAKRIYSQPVDFDEIDCYAVFSPETDEIYYLKVDEIPQDMVAVTLRIEPTKNGQEKRVWWAKDFRDPRRIVLYKDFGKTVCREVSELDELAIAKVSATLVEAGIQPCPAMSQYLPFDMIAIHHDMKMLKRVRVGWGSVQFSPFADQYAVYDPLLKSCFLFDATDIPCDRIRISAESRGLQSDKFVG